MQRKKALPANQRRAKDQPNSPLRDNLLGDITPLLSEKLRKDELSDERRRFSRILLCTKGILEKSSDRSQESSRKTSNKSSPSRSP